MLQFVTWYASIEDGDLSVKYENFFLLDHYDCHVDD